MGSDIVAKDFQHSNIFDLFQIGFGQKIDFWFQTCIVSYFELMWNFFFWIQINILKEILFDRYDQGLHGRTCRTILPVIDKKQL